MSRALELGGELRAQIPATLEAVEAFVQRFRHWHEQVSGGRDAFKVELLLRESLGNSVTHGVGPQQSIHCAVRGGVRGGARRVLIALRDEGPGFDWRARAALPVADDATSGRGIAIYYRYAHRVRFNARGNGLVLVRLLGPDAPERQAAGSQS